MAQSYVNLLHPAVVTVESKTYLVTRVCVHVRTKAPSPDFPMMVSRCQCAGTNEHRDTGFQCRPRARIQPVCDHCYRALQHCEAQLLVTGVTERKPVVDKGISKVQDRLLESWSPGCVRETSNCVLIQEGQLHQCRVVPVSAYIEYEPYSATNACAALKICDVVVAQVDCNRCTIQRYYYTTVLLSKVLFIQRYY